MKNVVAAVIFLGLSIGGPAWAQECSRTIEGNDQMQFNASELRVRADCGEVTITLKHAGQLPVTAMGHNFVVTRTSDYKPLADDALAVGAPNYLPEGDSRIIAATGLVGGGEETSVVIDVSGLEVGGDYTFFCTFPAHHFLMNGRFLVE